MKMVSPELNDTRFSLKEWTIRVCSKAINNFCLCVSNYSFFFFTVKEVVYFDV